MGKGNRVPASERLWQVTAPHYCAGFVTNADGVCIQAASILAWAIGKRLDYLLHYFIQQKRFAVTCYPDNGGLSHD